MGLISNMAFHRQPVSTSQSLHKIVNFYIPQAIIHKIQYNWPPQTIPQ